MKYFQLFIISINTKWLPYPLVPWKLVSHKITLLQSILQLINDLF